MHAQWVQLDAILVSRVHLICLLLYWPFIFFKFFLLFSYALLCFVLLCSLTMCATSSSLWHYHASQWLPSFKPGFQCCCILHRGTATVSRASHWLANTEGLPLWTGPPPGWQTRRDCRCEQGGGTPPGWQTRRDCHCEQGRPLVGKQGGTVENYLLGLPYIT